MSTRRSFFSEMLAAAAITGAAREELDAQTAALTPHDSQSYWGDFFNAVDPATAAKGGSKGGIKQLLLPDKKRKVRYLQARTEGLAYANEIQRKDLLDYPGDVAVSVTLGQFRLGGADKLTFRQLENSQLRLDAVQTRPFLNVLSPMAWTAIASVFADKAGKLPTLQSLGFHTQDATAGTNRIILPRGVGKFAVNVSMANKKSMLRTILQKSVQYAGMAAPLISLPAISIPALRTFTDLYSALEDRTHFILNSQLTDVLATQQAYNEDGIALEYVPLTSGNYLAVPDEHTEALKGILPNLEVRDGYLVHKANQGPGENVPGPDVTYLTFNVKVAPITLPQAGPAQSASSNADEPSAKKPGAGAGAGAGKSGATGKKKP